MAQKRKDWNSLISGFKASDLVFLDESGCNTDMTRRYAYSLGGSRAVDSAPLSKPKNTTILSSIQLDGTLRYTTFSGGTTVERFKRYLETDLLPHLNENSVLIMDNMKSHHAKAVRNLLDSSGVRCIYAKFVSAAKDGADCFIDWMLGSLFGQVAGMAIFPSTLLGILPVGCLLYMHGTLSAETFLAVIVLSFGVIQPLITAFSYTDDIAQVTTIVGKVAKVLSGEDMQRPERAEKLPADNSIELKSVRFAYHDKEVLHGINLHIAPGTVNALVEPSCNGKSTIARLIASLWDVKDGTIELGGVDIRTLPLAECTKRIAYVSQDNYLFDLSVMDNIRMGKKGASDEEVIDAAKKCGCHEFIMGLENGYQTVYGASGGHLSGGERQRISIARAMLKDAPIVILDEATASFFYTQLCA